MSVKVGKLGTVRLKGKDMTKLRQDCFARDGGLCVECGYTVSDDFPKWHTQRYEMAHIIAKRIGGDTLANVKTMCKGCHTKSHNAGGKPCSAKVSA